MLRNELVSKNKLKKLPEEVLKLVNMGQYSLYRISIANIPEIEYALRTGVTKIYLLKGDGQPIKEQSNTDFLIESKVLIEDIYIEASVPNFYA